MGAKRWNKVDAFITGHLLDDDPVLAAVLKANEAAGLPAIDVSPAQGKLLNLLVKISGAKTLLEIGTLGAYSTIWMARALPADGRAITMEYESRHAQVAKANIERAGLSGRVEVRVGAASENLPKLAEEGLGPFDFVFIDADKPNNPVYLDWAVKLSRPGTVIILDNVIRDGDVIEAKSSDPTIIGTRAAFELIGRHPKLDATAIQTVGAKGYDGFAVAIVK